MNLPGGLAGRLLPPERLLWLREFWFGDIQPLDNDELKAKWANKNTAQQFYVLPILRKKRDNLLTELMSVTNSANTAITVLAIILAGFGFTISSSVSWAHSLMVFMAGSVVIILIWSYMPRIRESWRRWRNNISDEDCDTAEAEYIQLKQDNNTYRRRLWRAHCYQSFALHLCAVIVIVGCWVLVRG